MEVIFDWYTNAYDSARRNKRTPAFESDGYWPSSGWLAACEIRTGSGSQPVPRISSSANFTSSAFFSFRVSAFAGLPASVSACPIFDFEPKLIKNRLCLEQARKARRKPEFLPSVNFQA